MILRRIVLLIVGGLAVAPMAEAGSKAACIRAATPAPGLLAESASGKIELGRGPRTVTLTPICMDGSGAGLSKRVAAAPPHRRFLLVIEDLRAEIQPGVLFDLRLAGEPERAGRGGGVLLGTLNFFAAQRPGVTARPRRVSYDVTEILRRLAARGDGGTLSGLVLTIRPVDAPAPGSDAAIGHIALVEQ